MFFMVYILLPDINFVIEFLYGMNFMAYFYLFIVWLLWHRLKKVVQREKLLALIKNLWSEMENYIVLSPLAPHAGN